MNDAQIQQIMAFVDGCTDAKQLRQLARNAKAQGADDVHRAAMLRLYAILPSEAPGTFEYDVWHSIHALEGALTEERGKTTRLSRTRQKISRDGELKAVADLIMGNKSQGFDMLMDRNMGDLTFEALALRHTDRFSTEVLEAARERLETTGYQLGRQT